MSYDWTVCATEPAQVQLQSKHVTGPQWFMVVRSLLQPELTLHSQHPCACCGVQACMSYDPTERPPMGDVLKVLKGMKSLYVPGRR